MTKMGVDLRFCSERGYPWVAWSFIFLFKSEIVIAIILKKHNTRRYFGPNKKGLLNDPHVDENDKNDLEAQESSS